MKQKKRNEQIGRMSCEVNYIVKQKKIQQKHMPTWIQTQTQHMKYASNIPDKSWICFDILN